MYSERDITDAASGQLLAISRSVSFLRGDGGFSERGQASDPAPTAARGHTRTQRPTMSAN